MGLLYIDGFEGDSLSHWQASGGTSVVDNGYRRSGYRGARFSGAVTSLWVPVGYANGTYPSRITFGVATRLDAFDGNGGSNAFGLMDLYGNRLIAIQHQTYGSLRCLLHGATPLFYTSKTWVRHDKWHYIELDFIQAAQGYVELRVNGQTEGTWAGDTRLSGQTATIGYFIGGSSWSSYSVDDLYIADDGIFREDCAVDMLYPSGATAQADFTAVPSGPNYTCVDETTSDDDVTYVQSSTTGHKDLYTFSNTVFDGTIHGVQVMYNARKSTAGPRSVRSLLKVSSTTETGVTAYPSFPDFQYRWDPWTVKPGGGTWTYADVNALEAGVEVVT